MITSRSLLNSPFHSLRPWLAAFVAMAAALASLPAQSGGNATVTGSVTNSATRAFLEGAQVSLLGTNQEVLTERDGQFEITGVAPGEYTVVVSYTGLDTQRRTITVQPGRNVVPMIGLTADIYVLDVFNVSGEREGSAAAITAQRYAPNVKSVVATDAFGHVVDGNIGEMLKRVSGVATNLN
ncbi:MAG: carboxypeptidase regulatory-like domain-containing protein, partial [Opitutus sp.]